MPKFSHDKIGDSMLSRAFDKAHCKWIIGLVTVGFFVLMIIVYSLVLIEFAWQFFCQHSISGYSMFAAILIIPAIGLYLIFQSLWVGVMHQHLAARARQLGYDLDISHINCEPSGRLVRVEADKLFEHIKREWKYDPDSWIANYRLARAYDYAGDRSRGREFMRKAVQLEKQDSSVSDSNTRMHYELNQESYSTRDNMIDNE